MVFAFRNQPLKSLFLAWSALSILVRLPLWALTNAHPAWRPRPSWTLARTLIVYVLRAASYIGMQTVLQELNPPPPPASERDAHRLGFVWVAPVPESFLAAEGVDEVRTMAAQNDVHPERISGYWYGPRDAAGVAGQRAAPGERVLYHLHGGGFIIGTTHPDFCRQKSMYDGFLEHLGPNLRIFCVDYRLASAAPLKAANPFPAALLDALAGYRYLVEEVGFDARNIIVSGDSAGGALAFQLVRYLAFANIPSLPIPGGAILISPTMDWAKTHTGPESAVVRNYRSDYVHGVMEPEYVSRALVGNLPKEIAATSVWISPGSRHAAWDKGMASEFPPTIIVAGEAEYTLDGMRLTGERLAADLGSKSTYYEVPDAAHECIVFNWYEPERTTVFKELHKWESGLRR